MEKKVRYKFLEHTADAYIAAYGKDLTEAFENAALAMFDVMTDVEKVTPRIGDQIDAEGMDEYALLYDWLEALLVKSETKGFLYSRFEISSLSKVPEGFRIRADIWGEAFDPHKHLQKVGVKAVTYHRMEITKGAGKVTLKFILDI